MPKRTTTPKPTPTTKKSTTTKADLKALHLAIDKMMRVYQHLYLISDALYQASHELHMMRLEAEAATTTKGGHAKRAR